MLIELHTHTKGVSSCGHIGVTELLDRYHAKGYDALVLTNHLNQWTIGIENAADDHDGFIDNFMSPVKQGREYAEKLGMKLFFGCELRFMQDDNDYLVYGISEEYLRKTPDILTMGIGKFHEVAREQGFLVYQAHPFRDWMQVVPPHLVDGIEVNNGHPRQESRNDIARLWADIHGLRMISGSDFHRVGDEAHGGIITFEDVNNDNELVEVLRNGNYKLICDYEGGFLRK